MTVTDGVIEVLRHKLPSIPEAVPGLKRVTAGGELAGPCPKCGGSDRFYTRPDGSWGCRQCGGKGGDHIDLHLWIKGTDIKGLAGLFLDRPEPKPKQPRSPAKKENLKATYSYRDENGAELFRVMRFEKPGHSKVFIQCRVESGKPVYNLRGVRRVLYRLPEVIQAGAVVIVEGEKDVDSLTALGIVATTSPGGAGGWKPEFSESLRGKDVVIVPDKDDAGRGYENDVLSSLAGKVKSMKVLHLPGPGKDVTDWIQAGGTADQLYDLIGAAEEVKPEVVTGGSILDRLSSLTVEGGYVEKIGCEAWSFKNLIIKNQITIICAKSGGGKTTVCFFHVVPCLIQNQWLRVFYFDLDSPASDHKRMFGHAESLGPKFKWVNPLTHGKGPEVIREALEDMVKAGERLDDVVFFFDTMKKFIDMLDKKSVKPFFSLLRQLTSLGGTVVLLGHANKHRGPDGNLVFEGVGDVMSDADALLFFERISIDGGVDITTVCDPDKGAKVRGLYQPVTFHITPARTVELRQSVTPVPNYSKNAKNAKLSDDEIMELVREYLQGADGPQTQSEIVRAFNGQFGTNKIRGILNGYSVHESEAVAGQIFYSGGGTFNKKIYGIKP